MALQPQVFDPRQEMGRPDFELQYKRDSYLKDVELHHHDFFELYFLMSGDVTYIIESRIYHVMPGDMLMISPRELHQLVIRPEMSSYERYVLWVDPQLLSRLSSQLTDLGACFDPSRPGYGNLLRLKSEDRSRIRGLLEALHRESQSEGFGSDLLRESLLIQLLVTVNRLVDQGGTQPESAGKSNLAVAKVIDYVNLHYGEPLSLDMLAEQFYVSKYHLSHEFNRQVGTSLYRYIQKKRLLIARQLLAQGKKPNEVYGICGFGDYAGFYRAFKAEYGAAPREYALSARHWNQEEK
ncbi:MAG: helix-turn-helix domain-containing protein [Oscillospiraceae bacterium]|nr:helix-turn-helix domain-containing protein [Oscillospiraceae bacterium]